MIQKYLVGGSVRDKILGVQSKDVDYTVVVPSAKTIDEAWKIMNNHLEAEAYTIFLSKKECLTVRARDKNNETSDYVLARSEEYLQTSRVPIVKVGTLYDDLARRDFTVNAIAIDENGEYIDPFNGIQDLKDMILRCPLNPLFTFMDDPLRLLRALRFKCTKGFTYHENLIEAFKYPEFWIKFEQVVSRDRVRDELQRMFKFDSVRAMYDILEFAQLNSSYPVLDVIFKDDIWLKPTSESR